MTASFFALQAARFLKNIFLAALLGPAQFGLWNALQVLLTYGAQSHLGVLNALTREIPMLRGRGQHEQIPRIVQSALALTLLGALIAGITLALGSSWMIEGYLEFPVVALLVPTILVQQLFLFYQFSLRGIDRFGPLAAALMLAAIGEVVFSLWLASLIGLAGVMLGLLVGTGIGSVVCIPAGVAEARRPAWHAHDVRHLLIVGFPMMISTIGYALLTTVDRLLVIRFLGNDALGLYSIGSLATTAVGYVPVAVNQVMYPRLAERFGATGNPSTLAGLVRVPTVATAYLMGLVLGGAILLIPLFGLLLPQYQGGVAAAQILLAGFYFLTLHGSAANFLLTINKQKEYVGIIGGSILLCAASAWAVLSAGGGIEAVALVAGCSYALYSLLLLWYVCRRYFPDRKRMFGAAGWKLLYPALLAAGLVSLLRLWDAGNPVITAVAGSVLFAVVYVGATFRLVKKEVFTDRAILPTTGAATDVVESEYPQSG